MTLLGLRRASQPPVDGRLWWPVIVAKAPTLQDVFAGVAKDVKVRFARAEAAAKDRIAAAVAAVKQALANAAREAAQALQASLNKAQAHHQRLTVTRAWPPTPGGTPTGGEQAGMCARRRYKAQTWPNTCWPLTSACLMTTK